MSATATQDIPAPSAASATQGEGDAPPPSPDPPAFPLARALLTPDRVLASIAADDRVAVPLSAVADDLCVRPDDLADIVASLAADAPGHPARILAWTWYDEESYRATEKLRRAAHDLAAERAEDAYHATLAGRAADMRARGVADAVIAASLAAIPEPVAVEYEPAPIVHARFVTLADDEAKARGLRRNATGYRWIPRHQGDLPDKLARGRAIREAELSTDPPGNLDQYPARDPGASSALRLADLKAGLVWPTVLLAGCRGWPMPGQDRGGNGGEGRTGKRGRPRKVKGGAFDGPPDPRGPGGIKDDADRAAMEKGRVQYERPKGARCEACGSPVEYRDGRVDGEQVNGGEECLCCGHGATDEAIKRLKTRGTNIKGVS
jgi:hypothetical protein